MRPEQPPPPPAWLGEPPSQACTQRLEQMESAADELIAELDLDDFTAAERTASGLLAELSLAVADLARERASGKALIRAQLEDLAELIEVAATGHGGSLLQVRALIARLRLVARN